MDTNLTGTAADNAGNSMDCESPLLAAAVRSVTNRHLLFALLWAALVALFVCAYAACRLGRVAWTAYRRFMSKNGPILATISFLHFVSLLVIISLLIANIVPSPSWCPSSATNRKMKVLAYILQTFTDCAALCWVLICITCYAQSSSRRLPCRLSSFRYFGPLIALLLSLLFNIWVPFSVANDEEKCGTAKRNRAFTGFELLWSYALPLALLVALAIRMLARNLGLFNGKKSSRANSRVPTGLLDPNFIGLPMMTRFRPASRRRSVPALVQGLRKSMRHSTKGRTKKVRDTNRAQQMLEFSSDSAKHLLEQLLPSPGNSRRSSARTSISIHVPVRCKYASFWRAVVITATHLLLKTPFVVWRLQTAWRKSTDAAVSSSYITSAAVLLHILQFLADAICIALLLYQRRTSDKDDYRPKADSIPSIRAPSPFGGAMIPPRSRRESVASAKSRRLSNVTCRTADGIITQIERSERIIRDAVSRSSFCNLVADYGSLVSDGALKVNSDVKTRLRSLSQTYSSNRLSVC